MTRQVLAITLYLLLVAGISVGIGWFALTDALDRLEERAGSDLSLASDRLTGQLQRFRELAVSLADHPVLTPLTQAGQGDRTAAQALLVASADRTGSIEVAVLDLDGRVIVSSLSGLSGNDGNADTPYFRRAMQGALGFQHAVDPETGTRMFLYAAPIFSPEGPVRGAVVVRHSVDRIEANWRDEVQTVFFTDDAGVVFISNRSELVFARREVVTDRAAIYQPDLLHPFFAYQTRQLGGHRLWDLQGGPYLPDRALHLSRPMPVAGLTAEILLDSGAAIRLASFQAATAAAVLLILGAVLFVLSDRRRALAARLEDEARAKAELEARVTARTRELSNAVESLRLEVHERKEAEAALTRAQQDLIQAGKLSALGQMSAGISHELNQPLMAIRSFADNAQLFLERDKPETVAQNLGQISELARRMGRIIKNLRAFARQETEAFSDVDLGGVVQVVLEMVEARMARSQVTLHWQPPENPVMVRGGEVRLQQVVMNLVTNAIDAMDDGPARHLHLSTTRVNDRVVLRVADSGPGIIDPGRIFDPFYSTKEVGHSEGMGLGLSIAYRIVESFGGSLVGRNRPEGGAEFVLELGAVAAKEAA